MHKILLMPQNVEVLISQGRSLSDLEFEEQGQNPISFGCKAGSCGTCVIEILEGAESLSKKNKEETDFLEMLGYAGDEFRLACQCRLNGTVKIRAAY